jgi:hypothetical protein
MNPNLAPIINAHRAPKGQPHDRQHHNVINGLPATRWADWDEALKLRNEVRR